METDPLVKAMSLISIFEYKDANIRKYAQRFGEETGAPSF